MRYETVGDAIDVYELYKSQMQSVVGALRLMSDITLWDDLERYNYEEFLNRYEQRDPKYESLIVLFYQIKEAATKIRNIKIKEIDNGKDNS